VKCCVLDPDTAPAVVVATQGVWDEEALAAALARDASYVGLVASPTRAAVVRAWLREDAGVADERLAALRAPAGLDLGAETAEEVALSILAELVQVRRGTASFVASPGPATLAGAPALDMEPIVDDIVLLDPVCGMTVDRAHARHLAEHEGAGSGGDVGVAVDSGHIHLARAGPHRRPARAVSNQDHLLESSFCGEVDPGGQVSHFFVGHAPIATAPDSLFSSPTRDISQVVHPRIRADERVAECRHGSAGLHVRRRVEVHAPTVDPDDGDGLS
jgi:hypothetical protein